MDERLEKLKEWGCDIDKAMPRMLNDESFYINCLNRIINDKNYALLEQALKQNDAEKGFFHAHALKGVIASLELTPMLKKISEIVEPLRIGSCENLLEKYYELYELNNKLAKILGIKK